MDSVGRDRTCISLAGCRLIVSPAAPVHETSTLTRAQAIAIPSSTRTSQPARPQPVRSGSSFSNFIRKLTGKSSKSSPPSQTVPSYTLASSRASTIRPTANAGASSISRPALAIDTQPLAPPTSQTNVSQASAIQDQDRVVEVVPASDARASATHIKALAPVDPREIPLPASPLPSSSDLAEDDVAVVDAPVPNTESAPTTESIHAKSDHCGMRSGPSLKAVKEIGLLRLEMPMSPPDELKEEEEDEEDYISPLTFERTRSSVRSPVSAGLQIGSPSSGDSEQGSDIRDGRSQLGVSPTSILATSPRSVSESSAAATSRQQPKQQLRVASQSPPKRSPVSAGANSPVEPASDLGRKGSKWRKSMMNISEVSSRSSSAYSTRLWLCDSWGV